MHMIVPGKFVKQATFKAMALQALRAAYPKGVGSAQQHRDTIRLYMCGWMDSLVFGSRGQEITDLLPEVRRISDPNWWPDESWVWWDHAEILLPAGVSGGM
jgi:hypothetical protein